MQSWKGFGKDSQKCDFVNLFEVNDLRRSKMDQGCSCCSDENDSLFAKCSEIRNCYLVCCWSSPGKKNRVSNRNGCVVAKGSDSLQVLRWLVARATGNNRTVK